MSESAAKILQEALRLPAEARAALAASLLDSLDQAVDSEAEAQWGREIGQRMRELDEGIVQPIPWAEARRQLFRD